MTNLDKEIAAIMELNEKRTQGGWYAEWYKTYTGVVRDEFTKIAELHLPPEVDGFSLDEYKEKARANAQFIAQAPAMVSIIQRLQAQLAERDDALQRISMLHYNNNTELLDAVTIAQAAIVVKRGGE